MTYHLILMLFCSNRDRIERLLKMKGSPYVNADAVNSGTSFLGHCGSITVLSASCLHKSELQTWTNCCKLPLSCPVKVFEKLGHSQRVQASILCCGKSRIFGLQNWWTSLWSPPWTQVLWMYLLGKALSFGPSLCNRCVSINSNTIEEEHISI